MLKLLPGLALFALVLAGQDAATAPSCSLVPGWVQDGQIRYYTADNLFEYMDGNSEGYFSYNFQNMRGITCKQGETTFVIDISDMGDADDAFGWFSATRDPRQAETVIGMGGQIVPRRLVFAKGKYYVEIAANPEGDFSAALKQWAAALEKLVPGSAAPPTALSWFSADRRQSLKLVPRSVLGLSILKRGYLAQYDYGKAFVVIEETPESAGAVMEKLRRRFGDATVIAVADEGFQATDQYLGHLCFVRSGRFVAGYAVTAEGFDPVALSATLVKNVE